MQAAQQAQQDAQRATQDAMNAATLLAPALTSPHRPPKFPSSPAHIPLHKSKTHRLTRVPSSTTPRRLDSDASSPRYMGPITISSTTKLQAIAIGSQFSAKLHRLRQIHRSTIPVLPRRFRKNRKPPMAHPCPSAKNFSFPGHACASRVRCGT